MSVGPGDHFLNVNLSAQVRTVFPHFGSATPGVHLSPAARAPHTRPGTDIRGVFLRLFSKIGLKVLLRLTSNPDRGPRQVRSGRLPPPRAPDRGAGHARKNKKSVI